jgi:phosphoribosyl-AMP cyclohydrolase
VTNSGVTMTSNPADMLRNNPEPGDLFTLEEGPSIHLNFNKIAEFFGYTGQDKNIVPVIVQNAHTQEVLLLAYVNEQALEQSIKRKIAVFWSTSRNELWVKGSTSGDFLDLKEIRINCEQNSLLFLVIPKNEGVCHTKSRITGANRSTCYYRKFDSQNLTSGVQLEFIDGLY